MLKKTNTSDIIGGIAFVAILFLVIGGISVLTALSTVSQSEIGFVVGGGPFDGNRHKVKSNLIKPGMHLTGTWDNMWTFPSDRTLRFQNFDVTITTIDGKKAQLQGQVGFRFVGEQNPALSKKFAIGLGSRKYGGDRPGESDKGWTNFLDQLVTPEINATFKEQFGRVYCADFEPACRSIDPRSNIPQANPERVYTNTSKVLQRRIDYKLGDTYLRQVRVRVNRITLPSEVQTNIDRVTAEQARTKSAQQAAKTAKAEAQAIRIKANALKSNSNLIALEVAKECKGGENCTIVVDATGKGVKPAVRTGR